MPRLVVVPEQLPSYGKNEPLMYTVVVIRLHDGARLNDEYNPTLWEFIDSSLYWHTINGFGPLSSQWSIDEACALSMEMSLTLNKMLKEATLG